MAAQTKNDTAWASFIKEKGLTLDGRSAYPIRASELKAIAQREPRLMTKFDTPQQRPKILRDHNYSVLAVANGEYLLLPGNVFAPVRQCTIFDTFQSRLSFPLVTSCRGMGESDYLDNAFNSGLLSQFTGIEELYFTIRGRERINRFDFKIASSDLDISVGGVQIEVDAGYEGEQDVVLIEAKIGHRTHFNIRQVYYPFRYFADIASRKRIQTLYFEYDMQKATYTFYEFAFADPSIFDSIHQIRCCSYRLVPHLAHHVDELLDVEFSTDVPVVPQADDLNKVLELLTLIKRGYHTVSEIADYFVFDQRQSNYYGEAAEYLGLIIRDQGEFELTELGKLFVMTNPEQQLWFVAKLIVNSWVFRELIRIARRKGYFTEQDIEQTIETVRNSHGQQRYHNTTVKRRRQTIVAWLHWLSEQLDIFRYDGVKYTLS